MIARWTLAASLCFRLASVVIAQEAASSPTWQYYCHGSATEFASAAPNVEISVLPGAGAPLSDIRSARDLYAADHPQPSAPAPAAETTGEAASTEQVVAKIEPLLRGHCCAHAIL